MKSPALIAVALFVFMSSARLTAQLPAPPPQPNGQILAPAQLDQLTGPIALYPDPLVAQILPASGQIAQIVLAENYLLQGGDPNGIDQQSWDSSVKAVAHYPDVLKLLDGNLQWTMQLGQAFLNQPGDVMDSIQRLRAQAQSLGNLQTTPQQTVEADDGEIEIVPANPDYLYVPTYDPGLIYYQPGYAVVFGAGFGIGLWLNHDFDWHGRRLFDWNHDHPRPANWWHERPADRREVISRAPAWRPAARVASRAPVINRGDRGYESRPVQRVEPAREARPSTPQRVEPAREVRPAPSAVQVHTIPARPTVAARQPVSAFANVQSAPAARAASQRGAQSRPESSRPAASAPPVSRPSPPPSVSRPSPPSGNGGSGRKQ